MTSPTIDPKPSPAATLRARCDPAAFPFRSTAELPAVDGMIGQERAVDATSFGLAMRGSGYNLFVLGPSATGKATTMRRVLERHARTQPAADDLCYVHNFVDPYRPTAFMLPAGRGAELRREMARLVEECRARVPRAFESEEFERQKSRLVEDLGTRQSAEAARLAAAAQAEHFALLRSPQGLMLAPAPKGEPLDPAAFAALPEPERERIQETWKTLEPKLEAAVREMRRLEREARDAHEALVRATGVAATRPLIQELREAFEGLAPVQRYLDHVEEDLVEHADEFRHLNDGRPQLPFLPSPGGFLDRYRVNVVVDRTGLVGAPLVFERNPSHANLVGRIEHHVHFGTLVSDFTLIKAGALHRANGGYLVLEIQEVLKHPMAWEAVKKALKAKAIRIEEAFEELRTATIGLAPEMVPLDLKVILLGSPLLYYLLYALDEDVRELFKVKVDFDDSLPRTPDFELLLARFVGTVCREENLRHFSAGGVARLIEQSSRSVAHQGRLSARLGETLELVRESAFFAGRSGHDLVEAEDVRYAVAQRVRRSNLVEEHVARALAEGVLIVATDGDAVGQVNGISVSTLGDYTFGRPARITARVYSGKPGVVDIEREAKLGGRIHSKGVMILTGYLAGRHARDRPLALAASIAFEQQYDEVEGDSASAAELLALLSSLTAIPLTQSLAITGSVNQRGDIQPIGGVNEKIEGFFDLCRARGLDGRHGVVIPAANLRHLMLRDEVVEAVARDQFRIHAITHIDEAIGLLTGRVAGEAGADGTFPPGSFNAEVDRALAAHVATLRALRGD